MKTWIVAAALFFIGFTVFAAEIKAPQIIEIKSTADGFVPNKIDVSADAPVILKVTRTTNETCGTEIQIKDKKINQKLPLNETVTINLGKLKKGEVKFHCAMNMIKGTLKVN